jgi:hypothetical protein
MAVLKKKKQEMKRIPIHVSDEVWLNYQDCKRHASKLGWIIDYIGDYEKWMIRQNQALRQKLEMAKKEPVSAAAKKLHDVAVTENEAEAALNGIEG